MIVTKIIETLIQPLGLLWFIHVAVAIRSLFRRQWKEAIFCGTIAICMVLIGSTPLPSYLLATLERPYAGRSLEQLAKGDAVVLLGGTLSPSRNDPFHFELGEQSDRFVTAVELIRQGKAFTLVLGGGGGALHEPAGQSWSEPDLLADWFTRWDLGEAEIVKLKKSLNTREEAGQIKALAENRGWKRIFLVTSASHMKRGEALLKPLGLEIIPVACDFEGLGALERKKPFNPLPQLGGFRKLELYLHERIGWVYYRLRGWI